MDGRWDFCPYCGKAVKERNVFDNAEKEFEKIGKVFGLPKMNIKPRSDGISIIITPNTGMRPKIIRRTLEKTVVKRPIKIPKFTEEPETKIERSGKNQIINIRLPGVKHEDIEVKRLENSIEIKAFTGDKAYFKLIPIPSNAAVNKSFKDEMLKIEVLR